LMRDLAAASENLPLDAPDQADENTLNRILWHALKGADAPYPAEYAGAHGRGLKKLRSVESLARHDALEFESVPGFRARPLDDDTRLLSLESVESAIRVMRSDARAGAVAFAQAESDGRPWPERMQPSPVRAPSVVSSFIGFAHLVRRAVFLELSGYRESFEFYGEEKDFCLRLIDAGYQTIYLPQALVAHVVDGASRDRRRYLRCVSRNDCLNTLYNDPLWRLVWMLPARFALYFRMRRTWKIDDPWGGAWLARDLVSRIPRVWKERRPVSRATLARWRALRSRPAAYELPRVPAESLPGR